MRWPYGLICFIYETGLLQLKKNLPKPYNSIVHGLFRNFPCIKNGFVFNFSTKLHVIFKNICMTIPQKFDLFMIFLHNLFIEVELQIKKIYIQLCSIAIQCNTGSNKMFPFLSVTFTCTTNTLSNLCSVQELKVSVSSSVYINNIAWIFQC